MGTVDEIKEMEEQLRIAELGPDPQFFEQVISDEALLDGEHAKQKVVAAHRPGAVPKFTKVEMSDFEIIDHGMAAVVICKGTYESSKWAGSIRFMRTWLKKNGRWQIISAATLPSK